MTKSDLIAHIAEKTGISRSQASDVLDSVVNGIITGLRKDGSAPLTGLGIFKLVDRKARMGRNPATGESIHIPAKKVLKFKPSKGIEQDIA
ncbi:MAG: HU family DNA-binding protein [Deltaproteobacteria bacterium]